MNQTNRELLEKFVEDRLVKAINSEPGNDAEKIAFEEAMKAADRAIELERLYETGIDQDNANRIKVEEAEKDRKYRLVEFAAGMVIAPAIEALCKLAYAKVICKFEDTDAFTKTPGRQLSGLFRWKK